MSTNLKKAVLSTVICNSLIWYDYALYGTLIEIISHLFFPNNNPFISLLEAFGVFAVGFIMRPIGAALFGHFGDSYSRKYALLFAIVSMTVPMFLLSVLPTYDSIGIVAPILLILVRLIQGIALGGEAGNAAFLIEYAPSNKRGFICSFEVFSAIVGSIISAMVIAVCKMSMSFAAFQDWGWRIPFVFGVVIGFIGMLLRYLTDESPAYTKAHKEHKSVSPLKELFRENKKKFFVAIGIDSVEEATLYVFLIFFAQAAIATNNQYTNISYNISLIVLAVLTIFFASLSDKYGRKKVLMVTFISLLFTAYPIFWLLHQENVAYIACAQLLLAVTTAASLGPVSAAALESFPISIRYSGFALSRNIAAAIFGGMAPITCTYLAYAVGETTGPCIFFMLTALVGIVSLSFFKDKYKEKIH